MDQTHSLYGPYSSLGAGGIAYGNAAALLSSVLQGKKPVINRRSHIASVEIINAENAAFLVKPVVFQLCVKAKVFHLSVSFIPAAKSYRPRRLKTSL